MKKIRKKSFFEDEHARIPFSVIGVFLILGSSFTAVYVTKLESEKSEEISKTIDFSEIENFLRLAEADMATALNLAGLKGLKEIGERPIINVNNPNSNPYGDTADTVNENRVKSIIMRDMNMYLNNSYRFNAFNNGRYAINIEIPENSDYPIQSRDEISFETIDMTLDRAYTNDYIGPPNKITHTTYWVANIPIKVDIVKIDGDSPGEIIINRTIDVSTIITCRYNLLKELVDEYHNEIDGAFSSLWIVCTALFNIYSLARGMQHWSQGTPQNVVDNDDLHLMINAGLLLEQGFVFGSVDPMALVGLATNMGSSQDDAENDVSSGFENGQNEYGVNTSNTTGVNTVDNSTSAPTTNVTPDIDLEAIASMPLYELNSIILTFEHETTHEKETVNLPNPTEEEIRNTVEDMQNQGYQLIDTEKNFDDMTRNQTTVDHIKEIISIVYTAEMQVIVERGNNLISTYESEGYIINTGSTPWISTSFDYYGSIDKPAKGTIQPGDILYGEFYKVNDEEVLIKIVLDRYSNYYTWCNDIKDVFYRNNDLNDDNLEDTVNTYKTMVLTDANLTSWLSDKNITGTMNSSIINGNYNAWVETEAWQALEDILEEIKKIELDPSITIENYPDPNSFMEAAKADLLKKYDEKINGFENILDYLEPGTSLFISAGKKAVYFVREWYVGKVRSDIENYYSNVQNMVDGYMDDALDGSGASADDVHDVLNGEAMNSLKNQFVIPMGYDITLTNEWTESIRIAVDQNPDYLKPNEVTTATANETKGNEERFYALKLRNTCIFGPTGVPVLPPTPVTPWIFTFNVWKIDVKGEYKEFKVVDTTDETHFNPLFGHEAQIYTRKHEAIKDGSLTIGENTRLTFAFSTVATAFVPPYQFMVGDTDGIMIEETNGWT